MLDTNEAMPPLLKWPGGKRALTRHIVPLLQGFTGTYYEPFAGGAAVFFHLRPARAIVSDADEELISCYQQVRDEPGAVIRRLKRLRNSEDDYYQIREWTPRSAAARAARLIYLCSLSFNGIYRRNLRGRFNVPYGHKTHIDPCDEVRIFKASAALRDVTLSSLDFERALKSAKSGDFVYLDPPYTVAHGNNGFVKYNAKIFSWDDQIRLASLAEALARRGCAVVVSNADHPSIDALYEKFERIRIQRPSRIAADVCFRKPVMECIYYAGGEPHVGKR